MVYSIIGMQRIGYIVAIGDIMKVTEPYLEKCQSA